MYNLLIIKIISLFIFVNVYGNKYSELVNKNLKGGVQKLNFDGSQISNGLYFILLENNGKRFGSSVIKRN